MDANRILETCAAWRGLLGKRSAANPSRGREHVYAVLATHKELNELDALLAEVAKVLNVPGSKLRRRSRRRWPSRS